MKLLQNPHFFLTFDQVHNPLRLLHETTSERPKVPRTHQFSALLTWKCASRHNGVHFFRHLNFHKWSQHGVFCTWKLRATMACTFSTSQLPKVVRTWRAVYGLGNVLRATTACTFSTSQLSKVVREWCVLHVLTWKCASRHNGVHFFDLSTFRSGPRMVCFARFDLEMCFAPQRRALFRPLNFQKWSENGVFCTF